MMHSNTHPYACSWSVGLDSELSSERHCGLSVVKQLSRELSVSAEGSGAVYNVQISRPRTGKACGKPAEDYSGRRVS